MMTIMGTLHYITPWMPCIMQLLQRLQAAICSPDNLSLMRPPYHMNVNGSLPELLRLATLSMTFPALAALPYCFGKLHAARNGLLLGCLLPLLLCLGKLCGPHMAHQGLQ